VVAIVGVGPVQLLQEAVVATLHKGTPQEQQGALRVLGGWGGEPGGALLAKALHAEDLEVQIEAVRQLAHHPQHAHLLTTLDGPLALRTEVLRTLGALAQASDGNVAGSGAVAWGWRHLESALRRWQPSAEQGEEGRHEVLQLDEAARRVSQHEQGSSAGDGPEEQRVKAVRRCLVELNRLTTNATASEGSDQQAELALWASGAKGREAVAQAGKVVTALLEGSAAEQEAAAWALQAMGVGAAAFHQALMERALDEHEDGPVRQQALQAALCMKPQQDTE